MHCLVLHFLSVVDLSLPGTYHLEEEVTMAARNCLYLPALSSIIEQAMKLPVARLFQEVMGATLALRACAIVAARDIKMREKIFTDKPVIKLAMNAQASDKVM